MFVEALFAAVGVFVLVEWGGGLSVAVGAFQRYHHG